LPQKIELALQKYVSSDYQALIRNVLDKEQLDALTYKVTTMEKLQLAVDEIVLKAFKNHLFNLGIFVDDEMKALSEANISFTQKLLVAIQAVDLIT